MVKIISKQEACDLIKDGSVVMFGGFLAWGSAWGITDLLADQNKVKNLTLVGNDTAFADKSYGRLMTNRQVSKVIVSHIGTNSETQKQNNNKEIEVELVPQGTLAERIRAAGAGLGGILTPTGIGTLVEEGKKIIEVKGKSYILEEPLYGDVALVYADKGDKYGNLFHHGVTRNWNMIMPMACKTVIAEVKEIVEGCLDPDCITVPSIFVDYIVQGEKDYLEKGLKKS